jgi:hypothetical protein
VINSDGRYFYAKMKSSQVRKFGSSKRKPLQIQKAYNIGPGQYRLPSEFGYYQARNEYNQQHGIKRRRNKRKVFESDQAWFGNDIDERGDNNNWFKG